MILKQADIVLLRCHGLHEGFKGNIEAKVVGIYENKVIVVLEDGRLHSVTRDAILGVQK